MIEVYSVSEEKFTSTTATYLSDDLYNFLIFPTEVIASKGIYEQFIKDLIEKLEIKADKKLYPIYLISDAQRLIPDDVRKLNINSEKGYIEAIKFLREKYPFAQFLFNSCSFIRFLFLQTKDDHEKAINFISRNFNYTEFEAFKDNIKEYLDLNFEIQSINQLRRGSVSSGAHGKHVTPFLYSNELEFRKETEISKDLEFFLPKILQENDKPVRGIVLRILLIDDKLGKPTKESKENPGKSCKAKLIKELMELSFDEQKRNNVCWKTPTNDSLQPIAIFQDGCAFDCIGCKIRRNGSTFQSWVEPFEQLKQELASETGKIQIVAVKNLEIARELLADPTLRFDLIMMDYLLDNKRDENDKITNEREYATEFWGDGEKQYFNLEDKTDPLFDTYDKIKSNRGPMQRYWVFPITAFNQTFIDDLRIRGVRLIDYYWYLSRGADPINTPYLFIYSLNNFLQMMLDQAIFSPAEIIGFVEKSLIMYKKLQAKLKETNQKNKNRNIEDGSSQLKAFFSTEYTYFMNKYAIEDQVKRDMDNGSLFAHYVYQNFIMQQQDLLYTSKAIRRLYHSLAFGEPRDYIKTLERLYRMLDLFKKNFLVNINFEQKIFPRALLNQWEQEFMDIITNRFEM